jgi:hypothetical protein
VIDGLVHRAETPALGLLDESGAGLGKRAGGALALDHSADVRDDADPGGLRRVQVAVDVARVHAGEREGLHGIDARALEDVEVIRIVLAGDLPHHHDARGQLTAFGRLRNRAQNQQGQHHATHVSPSIHQVANQPGYFAR